MYKFSKRSERNLKGIHTDLEKVIREAIKESPYDFVVVDGMRTKAEQEQLVKNGASWTMRSRHLTGKAVDIVVLVGGKPTWELPYYNKVATHVLKVAKNLKVPLTWGGVWKQKDSGHFELDKDHYGY